MPKQLSNFFILLSVFLVLGMYGCGHKEPLKKPSVTQAQKSFEDKCVKDHNLHVRTHQIGHTFWIYLPVKDPIFDYEVHKSQPSSDKKPKFVVNSAEGSYENAIFNFQYDIIDKKKVDSEDNGFGSSYTESYTKIQTGLFTALYEVFADMKPTPSEESLDFFVIIITDIKKGIETRFTFYWQDFLRSSTGDIPSDEFYNKRVLSDVKGSPDMIGDETGSHITYTNITMDHFLTEQIVNRIKFKFQRSDFSPSLKYDNDIIAIVADTLRYYKFDDFTNVRLSNLRLDTKYLFDKAQLINFGDDKPEENKGRLIHIKFRDGKPQFNEEPLADQAASPSREQKDQ